LGLTAFLPVQRKVCCRFLLPLKSITHSWVWTCELWVKLQGC
jgi:hypothetical protein